MKLKYRHRLNEIMRVLLSDHPGINSNDLVDELSKNYYNYEGRRYEGTYDEAKGILVLYVTQKHRGKNLSEAERIPLTFKVIETVKVVFSESGKPMLTNVFLLK